MADSKVYDTADPRALAAKFERYRHLLPAFAEEDAAAAAAPAWPALDAAQALDRARGCLLGLAVGDAIGAAAEFLPRDTFPALADLSGGGPLQLEPGHWTDATAMALCLGQSLVEDEDLDQDTFMSRLRDWLTQGDSTPQGLCVAPGHTTRAAIERYMQDDDPAAGLQDGDEAGNASLVRLAPLAIFAASRPGLARLLSGKQSRATHANIECLDACELFVWQLVDALGGADKEAALRPRVLALTPNTLAINGGDWRQKNRDEVRSSAYVVDTLDAALWAVGRASTFRETVLLAANLGEDASGTAAAAGQLAGALYGASAIPADWLATLAWRDRLQALADRLAQVGLRALAGASS